VFLWVFLFGLCAKRSQFSWLNIRLQRTQLEAAQCPEKLKLSPQHLSPTVREDAFDLALSSYLSEIMTDSPFLQLGEQLPKPLMP
jgi:hypothetical protein